MKRIITILLCVILCLSVCACANSGDTSQGTSTQGTTSATQQATQKEKTLTLEEAVNLVESSYTCEEGCQYVFRETLEIDDVSYHAVDVKKTTNLGLAYISTYFVKTDGSEILEGYFQNDIPIINGSDVATVITEDTAITAVEEAYEIEEDSYLIMRGIEEIDGVKYFAVDLRRSLEANSSYLATFFVEEDGTITIGYYEDGEPVIPY